MQSLSHARFIQLALAVVSTMAITADAVAGPGDPVAIRRSEGCFVIETMWNLAVTITTAKEFELSELQGVDLLRHSTSVDSSIFRYKQDVSGGVSFDRTLDRPPNTDTAAWKLTSELANPSSNAIRVRAAGPVIVIDVDGVRITYIDHDAEELDQNARRLTQQTDVLVVGPVETQQTPSDAGEISRLVESDIVVLADDQSSSTGNTLAIAANTSDDPSTRRTVRLSSAPVAISDEVERLIKEKERACKDSQKVFAQLSVRQLNFRPSNGTHTPRWNTEHMMGRELLFFSQIYNAQDKSIPVIDLNPKQMPPDYVAKHPDWTGKEEARQMERVTAFTRRFAYLFKSVPLDEKAAGSGWKLRALLLQMDRHYTEHTANVKKKFELKDWPKE